MSDELALRERASRGAAYGEILRNGAVIEALDHVAGQYAAELLNCQDRDERDRLWLAVQVTRKVKEHIGQIAGDGTLASHQLAEIRRLRR